jgi:hypothetical protein
MEQEEARLRARTSIAVSRMRRDAETSINDFQVRLVTATARLPEGSHAIRRLSLTTADGVRLEVRPGSPMDNDASYEAYLYIDPEYALWSLPKLEAGEMVRCVENTGGKFLHAQAFFKVPVLHRDQPLALEIEHAAGPTERLAVEIYDSGDPAGYRRLGLLSVQETEEWRVDHFSIVLNMLARQPTRSGDTAMTATESASAELDHGEVNQGEADTRDTQAIQDCDRGVTSIVAESSESFENAGDELRPVETLQTETQAEDKQLIKTGAGASYQDKWKTSEAEFVEIVPRGRSESRPQFVFALGEPVMFKVVVSVHTDLPVLWLAGSFYDQFGNRVFLTVQKFSRGAPPGRHEINLTLERPNLRQGEYVGTFELLPEFDFNWRGLGRIPYLCLWDRCIFFKVDERYRGLIELGLVDVASNATSPTLGIAEPLGVVGTDDNLPALMAIGRRRP